MYRMKFSCRKKKKNKKSQEEGGCRGGKGVGGKTPMLPRKKNISKKRFLQNKQTKHCDFFFYKDNV